MVVLACLELLFYIITVIVETEDVLGCLADAEKITSDV